MTPSQYQLRTCPCQTYLRVAFAATMSHWGQSWDPLPINPKTRPKGIQSKVGKKEYGIHTHFPSLGQATMPVQKQFGGPKLLLRCATILLLTVRDCEARASLSQRFYFQEKIGRRQILTGKTKIANILDLFTFSSIFVSALCQARWHPWEKIPLYLYFNAKNEIDRIASLVHNFPFFSQLAHFLLRSTKNATDLICIIMMIIWLYTPIYHICRTRLWSLLGVVLSCRRIDHLDH